MAGTERNAIGGDDNNTGADTGTAKRQKTSHGGSTEGRPRGGCYHPRSIVTWNCNGFSTRANHNRPELRKLVRETRTPDLICIQEARLKAMGGQRGRPVNDGDHGPVRAALREALGGYVPFWSLADTKYAGTLTLVRGGCLEEAGSSADKNTEGRYDPDLVAFTLRSAIDLILRRLGATRSDCGLEEEETEEPGFRPENTQPPKKQQTSLTSFFAPKPKKGGASGAPVSLGRGKRRSHDHNAEGRFQFFFFPGMDVIQTYVPNNGGKEESFRRRRNWDRDVKKFLRDRKQILKSVSEKKGGNNNNNNDISAGNDSSLDRKLLWCGDLNVTRHYLDGSHWEKRGKQGTKQNESDSEEGNHDDDVYEWFRDEAKCLGSRSRDGPPKLPENVGIPGFTPAERKRFAEILKEGDFCDVWRKLHPRGVEKKDDDKTYKSIWELPNYSWRGSLAKTPGGFARFQGRGMRLDYFLLSPSKFGTDETIEKCEIRGYGTNMHDLFGASDHCAVELRFRENQN